MNNLPGNRLADRRLAETVEVDVTLTAGEAVDRARGRWLVVAGKDGIPIAAIEPKRLAAQPPGRPIAEVLAELPAAVVADAGTPLPTLLTFWGFQEIETDSAVIATGPEGGVWAGADMVQAVANYVRSSWLDEELPGEIRIPLLSRACRFSDGLASCTAVMRFAERPGDMPFCPNPGGLTAHSFTW